MQLDDSRSVMICKSNVRLHFTASCVDTRENSVSGIVVQWWHTDTHRSKCKTCISHYHITYSCKTKYISITEHMCLCNGRVPRPAGRGAREQWVCGYRRSIVDNESRDCEITE